jgi:hypothetical protein
LAVGVAESWEPDLVVFGNFSNDILPTFLMWGASDAHPVFVGTSVPEGIGTFSETLDLFLAARFAVYRQWMAARMARAVKRGMTPAAPAGWYAGQLDRLSAWSAGSGIPVLVLTIPAHTQADPNRCAEVMAAHDCEKQRQRYQIIVDAVSDTRLNWIDGQRIYAATGRSDFMLMPGETPGPGAWPDDAEHPTASGHQALALGISAEVEHLLGRRD